MSVLQKHIPCFSAQRGRGDFTEHARDKLADEDMLPVAGGADDPSGPCGR